MFSELCEGFSDRMRLLTWSMGIKEEEKELRKFSGAPFGKINCPRLLYIHHFVLLHIFYLVAMDILWYIVTQMQLNTPAHSNITHINISTFHRHCRISLSLYAYSSDALIALILRRSTVYSGTAISGFPVVFCLLKASRAGLTIVLSLLIPSS